MLDQYKMFKERSGKFKPAPFLQKKIPENTCVLTED